MLPKIPAITLLLIFELAGLSSFAQSSADIDSLLRIAATQNDSVKAKKFLTVGNLYAQRGMPDSAIFYYDNVIKYAEEKKSKKLRLVAEIEKGLTYARMNQFDKALENLFKVLRLAGNETKYSGKAKMNIGYVYMAQQRQKDAIRFLYEAEKDLIASKDTVYLFGVYSYLPVCLAQSGDTVKAMMYFQKGFDLYDAYGVYHSATASEREFLDQNRVVLTNNRLDYVTRKEDLEEDLQRLQLVLERAQAGSNAYHKFETLAVLGNISNKLGHYKESIAYGKAALALNDTTVKKYYQLVDIYRTIAKSASAMGDYKEAYQSQLLYKQYNDSLYNASKLDAIHSVEARYETEKKEQKITTLNKEKKSERLLLIITVTGLAVVLGFFVFAIRAKRLQKKLFVKEKESERIRLEKKMSELEQTALRAQMNPHFIFNCLNSVQRFVNNNDSAGVNDYLSTFASLIRQTLDNSGKSFISLEDEIKYLRTYISLEHMRSQGSFDYKIDIGAGINTNDIYIPGMIIQPFVENSIRHGLPIDGRRGELRLTVSRADKLVCIVEDNGEGMIDKAKDDDRNNGHTSVGRSLTEKRISLYNSFYPGEISLRIENRSVNNRLEKGTRVTLQFPLGNF